jgi:hypothetical protein
MTVLSCPKCGVLKQGVPEEFALNHLVGSFAEAVRCFCGER